jgi:purine-cytosine permease-like protein
MCITSRHSLGMKIFNVFTLLFGITILIFIVNHVEENFYTGASKYTNSQLYRNQAKEETSSPTGMIVGIVMGVVFLVVCIGYLFYRKYKSKSVKSVEV